MVISGETGIGKPDPAAFGRALELVDASPEHAVMIGDSWERDVWARWPQECAPSGSATVEPTPFSDARVSVATGPATTCVGLNGAGMRAPPRRSAPPGLTVTRIGLGLAALGRPAYITLGRDDDLGAERDTRHHGTALSRHARRSPTQPGIRYVDTARSYGRAEEFLASWLAARAIAPDAITVGSKWGYRYTGDWDMAAAVHETKDHSLAMFRDQLPQSTALLGPHLDLYQVHSATLESGVLDDHAVLPRPGRAGRQRRRRRADRERAAPGRRRPSRPRARRRGR